jgi:hypothetical protein
MISLAAARQMGLRERNFEVLFLSWGIIDEREEKLSDFLAAEPGSAKSGKRLTGAHPWVVAFRGWRGLHTGRAGRRGRACTGGAARASIVCLEVEGQAAADGAGGGLHQVDRLAVAGHHWDVALGEKIADID